MHNTKKLVKHTFKILRYVCLSMFVHFWTLCMKGMNHQGVYGSFGGYFVTKYSRKSLFFVEGKITNIQLHTWSLFHYDNEFCEASKYNRFLHIEMLQCPEESDLNLYCISYIILLLFQPSIYNFIISIQALLPNLPLNLHSVSFLLKTMAHTHFWY